MKTLEEIKEQYATSLNDDYETYTWQSLISGNGTRNMEHHHDAVAKLYAKEVSREALKNASSHFDEKTSLGKISINVITSESNIPDL